MLRLSTTLLTSPSLSPTPFLLPLRRLRRPSAAADSSSLRLLEWGRVCDAVAAFAGTAHGRDAAKKQLSEVDVSYEESRRLLDETAAAVQLVQFGAGAMDFAGLDTVAVKSAIDRVSRGVVIDGLEALAVVSLMLFAESLQITLRTATKQGGNSHSRFVPLAENILDAVIDRSFVKSIQDVIDDDGSVKDSASSELRRYREQVRVLESKLYQLMDKFMRTEENKASVSEICMVNGRCCIKVIGDESPSFDGLLLSSGSGAGSMVEPIVAVPLNDELQQARRLMVKAEQDVLSKLTDKMFLELDNIQNLTQTIIKLDKVTARAKYSIAHDGTFPDLYLPNYENETYSHYTSQSVSITSSAHLPKKQWKLYMPNAYHPLLLQQHKENLHHARRDVASATAEIRRRRIYGQNTAEEDQLASHLELMELRVSELEKDHPIPVDFMISEKTNVLVITGPNTGGKTLSLKTVGLASLMAKTGLYVLASEPVKIPWFDAIYADIGDEQSLTQSLSTFSGHLKQIGAIRARSTSKSLVLLDEVGAGTNPLEGAALGMSVLESFAEFGSFLTIVTTHHGELKTLKYSNEAFENACVEFDEENLKPTFKILWGVPGRSNAINIAERLGLPLAILESARKIHGTAGAEINGLIMDMEKFKQGFQQYLQEAQHYLMESKKLHSSLEVAQKNTVGHASAQRKRKARVISEYTVLAHTILRNKMRQYRESATTQIMLARAKAENSDNSKNPNSPDPTTNPPVESMRKIDSSTAMPVDDQENEIPEVGDVVYVSKLKNEATVVKVNASKNEVQVQAGFMRLKLNLEDVKIQRRRTFKS